MNSKELRDWVKKNNIILQTTDSFYECFKLYQEDSPDEFEEYFKDFNQNKLEIFFHSIDLRITNLSTIIDEKVIATLRIRYNDKHVGQYKLVFNLDAKIIDDVFVID